MATLRTNNFDFLATIGNILNDFNNNPNVELEDIKLNDYCDIITVNVYFNNDETARKDFFGFFESIGYTVTNIDGYTNENYYDLEEYPNGATVIPEVVTLKFYSEVDEVVYDMKHWNIKANDSLTIPYYEL